VQIVETGYKLLVDRSLTFVLHSTHVNSFSTGDTRPQVMTKKLELCVPIITNRTVNWVTVSVLGWL
jgi:hypothetical protein